MEEGGGIVERRVVVVFVVFVIVVVVDCAWRWWGWSVVVDGRGGCVTGCGGAIGCGRVLRFSGGGTVDVEVGEWFWVEVGWVCLCGG